MACDCIKNKKGITEMMYCKVTECAYRKALLKEVEEVNIKDLYNAWIKNNPQKEKVTPQELQDCESETLKKIMGYTLEDLIKGWGQANEIIKSIEEMVDEKAIEDIGDER